MKSYYLSGYFPYAVLLYFIITYPITMIKQIVKMLGGYCLVCIQLHNWFSEKKRKEKKEVIGLQEDFKLKVMLWVFS